MGWHQQLQQAKDRINPCKCPQCGFTGDFEIPDNIIDMPEVHRTYSTSGKYCGKECSRIAYHTAAIIATCPTCGYILFFNADFFGIDN